MEIDCIKLKEINKETRKLLKNKCGVYAVYMNSECFYVGASYWIADRVYGAFNPSRYSFGRKTYDFLVSNRGKYTVHVLICKEQELKDLEQILIKLLKAKLNFPNRFHKERRY